MPIKKEDSIDVRPRRRNRPMPKGDIPYYVVIGLVLGYVVAQLIRSYIMGY